MVQEFKRVGKSKTTHSPSYLNPLISSIVLPPGRTAVIITKFRKFERNAGANYKFLDLNYPSLDFVTHL